MITRLNLSAKYLALVFVLAFAAQSVEAAEAVRIEDNSFLIEEAYNQETGVVQHIFTYQAKPNGAWEGSFTEEVPVGSELHQLSVTVPGSRISDPGGQAGLGDVLLNYRYQSVRSEVVAVSPRISAVFPSGDYKKGLGTGATGLQFNLPISAVLSEQLVTHANFGLTYLPGAKNSAGDSANTTQGTFGASFIYLPTETFNLMAEFVANVKEDVRAENSVDRSANMIFSPGFRYAINAKDLQIVLGFALPISYVPGGGAVNQFYYVSFEHPWSSGE